MKVLRYITFVGEILINILSLFHSRNHPNICYTKHLISKNTSGFLIRYQKASLIQFIVVNQLFTDSRNVL